MITEDYVSFKIAKLLKEKGFEVNAINSWHIVPSETANFEDLEKLVCGDINEPEYSEDYYPMITLQMAMKWLREVHHVTIGITFSLDIITYEIQKDKKVIIAVSSSRSYEDMVEEAIKICLENLI